MTVDLFILCRRKLHPRSLCAFRVNLRRIMRKTLRVNLRQLRLRSKYIDCGVFMESNFSWMSLKPFK
jgi:hypothetical protein